MFFLGVAYPISCETERPPDSARADLASLKAHTLLFEATQNVKDLLATPPALARSVSCEGREKVASDRKGSRTRIRFFLRNFQAIASCLLNMPCVSRPSREADSPASGAMESGAASAPTVRSTPRNPPLGLFATAMPASTRPPLTRPCRLAGEANRPVPTIPPSCEAT